MKQLIQLFIITFVFQVIFQGSVFAKGKIDPTDYLENVAKTIIQVIEKNKKELKTDPQLSEKIIREYLLPEIDQNKFSKKVLKSKLWKSFTSEQQTSFKQGFIDQVINKYAKGLELYDGQSFTFEKARISKKGNALVNSKMKLASSESLTISYYLSPEGDSWKIANIIVDGINMAKSYRNQFVPRIGEIGVDKFIQELNAPEKIQ